MSKNDKIRCPWCLGSEEYIRYHDQEWGVPVHDDKTHFEFLVLEGAQAGLSWSTVLKKREGYRKNFDDFNPEKIAKYTDKKLDKILQDPSIIRNKLKVYSVRNNARLFLNIQKEYGSFNDYIWGFVGGRPIINKWKSIKEVPATSKESDALSKDLIKRGFKFTGSTVMYAHMQACGLVNDHLTDCYRYSEVSK